MESKEFKALKEQLLSCRRTEGVCRCQNHFLILRS